MTVAMMYVNKRDRSVTGKNQEKNHILKNNYHNFNLDSFIKKIRQLKGYTIKSSGGVVA